MPKPKIPNKLNTKPKPAKAEEAEEKVDSSKLPLVSVIDDKVTLDRCIQLLKEADKLKARSDDDGARLKEIREELGSYAAAFDLPGMRYGNMALVYSGERSNKRLSVELLIENGVSPEVIAQSYKETKPFTDIRLLRTNN